MKQEKQTPTTMGGSVEASSARAGGATAASSIVTNKLKVSSGNLSRAGGNAAAGHHPKPQPEKGPVMLLHELFTDAHFECVSSDGLQHSKFTVVVTVNDNQRFEGTGPSKKMAKNAAAKAALASICNISFSPLQQSKFGLITSGAGNGSLGGSNSVSLNGDNSFKQNKNFELPQTFADAVGKLVIEKFNEVMKGSDVYSRRKVLAGFVMTHGYDVKTARVISLATGTKCVSGEHMSVTGSVINDSHAEIIARRGLMDFFYSQLDLLCQQQQQQQTPESVPVSSTSPTPGNGQTVVTIGSGGTTLSNGTMAAAEPALPSQSDAADGESNASEQKPAIATQHAEVIFNKPSNDSSLYTLKEGIYFHLYINTAPCGDARVFSPHENDSMDVDKHPNRKARGQLRTKVESGEGTIPVKSSDGIQTWDGVLQGQRLLTMSCSDKISRWNVLGLQGSMLASVIEPIYLHSIVLGSLLHPAHMYRAICGRIENAIQGLPPPYRLNKPKLALMTSAESRNQTKPPNFSINWITNSSEVEIVNSFTGKLINNNTNTNKMSRLSKQSFYRRYAAIIARLPSVRLRQVKPTYFETKMSVNEYQQAKRELFAAFSKEDLGDWLKKPIEQDQFTLIVAKESEPPSLVSQPQTVPTVELNTLVSNATSSVGNCSK
ncbi:double-stranded RNA-specific editase Adar isoform X2 [Anopheles coustani]|uniref:double-stranded RNA-specific editase Adar isoform X2 n=1 Tax=Anopheles coustani TaxID=139045 RepID=UPI002659A7FD|nr:double-stranded RNA-specific editase Adar isoform X2 [Anopheles coustani]